MRGVTKAAAVATLVTSLGLGAAANALAANGTWTTTGKKTQTTSTLTLKKGLKRGFLHFGIAGNGKHKWTATSYRIVGKKGGKNDVKMQTVSDKDLNREIVAPFKKYPKGSYYIVFKYSVKGKKAFGGID